MTDGVAEIAMETIDANANLTTRPAEAQNIECSTDDFDGQGTSEPEVFSAEDQTFYNKIEDLAIQTLDSIEFYSNRDDEEIEKLWDNPSKIFASIRDKTSKMKEAWAEYYNVRKNMDELASQKESRERRDTEEEFKKLYLIKVTEAFENELHNMRRGVQPVDKAAKGKRSKKKESIILDPTSILVNTMDLNIPDDSQLMTSNEPIDYDVLIDCLGDGTDLWTLEEKKLLIEENKRQLGAHETILNK